MEDLAEQALQNINDFHVRVHFGKYADSVTMSVQIISRKTFDQLVNAEYEIITGLQDSMDLIDETISKAHAMAENEPEEQEVTPSK